MARFKRPEDIKVGVIGYGPSFGMGPTHLNDMKKAKMSPLAVCDSDGARLEAAQNDFPGIETYETVDKMLKESDVNLMTIITPHNSHAPLALKCLKAGRHVVCEKPLAITTADCDKMIAEAEKQDLVLTTYHNRYWDGSILRALKIIKEGKIGEVVRIDAHMGNWGNPGDWWRSSKTISGGILYDWGIHLIEYMLQITNSQVIEITGFSKRGFWADKTKWKEDTLEDEGFGIMRFENGIWGTLRITQIDSNPRHSMIEITGTKGTYGWDYDNFFLITPNEYGEKITHTGRHPEVEWWRYYQNIADHLTKGTKLVITPQWSRRPIHFIELMCKSAEKGMSMKPKYT